MQPLIRFYISSQTEDITRLSLACRLSEKAQTESQQVYILCANENMANMLDAMLWNFKPSAFIPHCREEDINKDDANVLIGIPPSRANRTNVFINLSNVENIDIPAGCNRVFEIVTQSSSVLQATRIRFQRYRERGFQPESIKLLD